MDSVKITVQEVLDIDRDYSGGEVWYGAPKDLPVLDITMDSEETECVGWAPKKAHPAFDTPFTKLFPVIQR